MTIYIPSGASDANALPTVLFSNKLELATTNVTTELPDFPYTNALDYNTAKVFSPGAANVVVVYDFGVATTINCLAIVNHNIGTVGARVYLQNSTDGISWATPWTLTPTDDSTIYISFASVSRRYYRLVTDTANMVFMGYVIAGEKFTFPAGVKAPYNPVWLSQNYELSYSTTMGGQFLRPKVHKVGGETTINLVSLDRSFAETTLLPFREHYNLGKPFIWAAGPSIFTRDVGFVWRKENSIMRPTFDQNGSFMSVNMEVWAYGR